MTQRVLDVACFAPDGHAITAHFCMPMSYQRLKSCTVTPACTCMHNPESTQCKKSVESLRVGLGVRHCHPHHHQAAPSGGPPATAGGSLARWFWACRAHGPPGAVGAGRAARVARPGPRRLRGLRGGRWAGPARTAARQRQGVELLGVLRGSQARRAKSGVIGTPRL